MNDASMTMSDTGSGNASSVLMLLRSMFTTRASWRSFFRRAARSRRRPRRRGSRRPCKRQSVKPPVDADVEGRARRDIERERVEGVLQLQSAAADERIVVAEQAHGGVSRDRSAGFVYSPFADEDAAGHDQCLRAPRRLGVRPRSTKELIEPRFHRCGFWPRAPLPGSNGSVRSATVPA